MYLSIKDNFLKHLFQKNRRSSRDITFFLEEEGYIYFNW